MFFLGMFLFGMSLFLIVFTLESIMGAPERIFLTTNIIHFPLKIFASSKIFEEFTIFEDLRRIFELTKILHIRLRSIFRIRRIFVFVFGPFSIFVATLSCTASLGMWDPLISNYLTVLTISNYRVA